MNSLSLQLSTPFCFPSLDCPGKAVARAELVAERLRCSLLHVIHLIEDGSLAALDLRHDGATRGNYRIIYAWFRYFIAKRTINPLPARCEEVAILRRAAEDICARYGRMSVGDPEAVVSATVTAIASKSRGCCTPQEFTAQTGINEYYLTGLLDSGLIAGIDIRCEARRRRTLRIPIEAQEAILRAMLCEDTWRTSLLGGLPEPVANDVSAAIAALN